MRKFNLFKTVCTLVAAMLCVQLLKAQNLKPQPVRTVDADVNKISGPLNQAYKMCIGAGRANEGLRADWQRQLRMVKKDCGFEYIRFHGLLTDDMGVYTEDKQGNPIYNWQYIDELYDFLLSIKVRPFVELGFMPKALASGNQTVFWWKGNITQPKDFNKWADLIKHLVQHWTERYGPAEVQQWYFEVWNEPNLNIFFSGKQADYFKLYETTAKAIKGVNRVYRVGGPATAGSAWIPDMISFCKTNNVPLDFVSTHTYSVKRGFVDLTGDAGTIINPDKNAVAKTMHKSRQQITGSTMPNLELHYTEWSSSYTPTDYLHDTYEEASFILDNIKRAAPAVTSLSYWTFTDIFEENGPRSTPFHGGFGLVNYQDIKKPAYYAYQYLNSLGKYEIINKDSSAIITKDNNGDIAVLVWNCTIDHPGDSTNDQVYYRLEHPAKSIGELHLHLSGLKPGKYQLEVAKTGYRAHDAYTAYLDLKAPPQLTRQQVALIKQQQNNEQPLASVPIFINGNGTFSKILPLAQNDVYFLRLIKK